MCYEAAKNKRNCRYYSYSYFYPADGCFCCTTLVNAISVSDWDIHDNKFADLTCLDYQYKNTYDACDYRMCAGLDYLKKDGECETCSIGYEPTINRRACQIICVDYEYRLSDGTCELRACQP